MNVTQVVAPGDPWKPAFGFEDRYYISPNAQVYSLKSGHFLSPGMNRDGYLHVSLRKDHGGKMRSHTRTIHRLMADTFLEKPDSTEPLQVRHLDGNRLNNELSNLAWGTIADNQRDKELHGYMARGMQVHNAKLTDEKVTLIRRLLAEEVSAGAIARAFGVTPGPIQAIKEDRAWRHV